MFGGLGSMSGTVVAAIVLGILNMVLQDFSSVRMIIYSLALILVMIFRPGGTSWNMGIQLEKTTLKKEAKLMDIFFEVKNLTKNFGGLTAVGDVTMELNEGELVGLIGPTVPVKQPSSTS